VRATVVGLISIGAAMVVSGHPAGALDYGSRDYYDSQTAAVMRAEIERQKIELALIKIKASQTPKDLEFACKDLLNIHETQDNCSMTCRYHRDRCNERGY
jgi:hypothetical protein